MSMCTSTCVKNSYKIIRTEDEVTLLSLMMMIYRWMSLAWKCVCSFRFFCRQDVINILNLTNKSFFGCSQTHVLHKTGVCFLRNLLPILLTCQSQIMSFYHIFFMSFFVFFLNYKKICKFFINLYFNNRKWRWWWWWQKLYITV